MESTHVCTHIQKQMNNVEVKLRKNYGCLYAIFRQRTVFSFQVATHFISEMVYSKINKVKVF